MKVGFDEGTILMSRSADGIAGVMRKTELEQLSLAPFGSDRPQLEELSLRLEQSRCMYSVMERQELQTAEVEK